MKRILLLCLGCFAIVSSSVSQERISLQMYRDAVLASSYDLKIEELSQMSVEERQSALKKGFLPTVSASGDFNLNFRDEMATIGGVNSKLKPYSFSVQPQIVQTIYDGHGVRNNYKQSQVELEMAKSNTAYTMSEIVYAAEYAYWNLVANIAYLGLTNKYVDIIKELRDIIKFRFKDGFISKRDLLMIDVRLGEAEYSLISAQKSYDISLSNFNILMRVSTDTPHSIDADIISTSVLPLRIEPESLLQYRADYKSATKRIEYDEYGIKLSRMAYNPKVLGGVSGAWRSNTPNINGGTNIDGYMFVRVSVPIFSWGKRRNSVSIARNTHLTSIHQRDDLEQTIIKEENTAWLSIEHSAQQVDKSVFNLNLGKSSLDLNTYSYNEGQIPITDVLSAQLSWLQLFTNAINAGYNYKVSTAQYRKAIGYVTY